MITVNSEIVVLSEEKRNSNKWLKEKLVIYCVRHVLHEVSSAGVNSSTSMISNQILSK